MLNRKMKKRMIITGLDPSLTPSLILLHKALIFFGFGLQKYELNKLFSRSQASKFNEGI